MNIKKKMVCMPIEILQDRRLTERQYRVLIALYSFYNPKTDKPVYPKRATLAEITGIDIDRISVITAELSKLGWLEKHSSNGAFSGSTHYQLTIPKDFETSLPKKANPLPKKQPLPLTESARGGLPNQQGGDYRISKGGITESVSKPLAKVVGGTKHTNEHTNEQTNEQTSLNPSFLPTEKEQPKIVYLRPDTQDANGKTTGDSEGSSKKPKEPAASTQVFEAYRAAFEKRYNIPLERNAKINSQIANIIKQVGIVEAMRLVEFYVGHNKAWYVNSCHDLGKLLTDIHAVRADMLRGVHTTNQKARELERTSTNYQNAMNAIRRIQSGEDCSFSGLVGA